ncbi:MAG TPA: hypothetical protein VJ063_01655 [Verrucomicrobiae bacterium]|nr:hypothetical protein [Verrucomicrobiae bacterium]
MIHTNTQFTAAMRVKVRFNAEAGQSPIVLDMRFLPRIGEKIHLSFRRVIEVMEVRRIDNDNRYGGIIRAKYVQEQRIATAAPPQPMPMPPIPIRSLNVASPAAVATAQAAAFGDLPLEQLTASQAGNSAPDTTCPIGGVMTPDPAL